MIELKTICCGEVITKAVTGRRAVLQARRLGISLAYADLRGAHLSLLDLSGMDFSGANLSGACLVDSDLQGSDFRGANLDGTELFRANVHMAKFTIGSLDQANTDNRRGTWILYIENRDIGQVSEWVESTRAFRIEVTDVSS